MATQSKTRAELGQAWEEAWDAYREAEISGDPLLKIEARDRLFFAGHNMAKALDKGEE